MKKTDNLHSHAHERAPETEGHVLHWASYYDAVCRLLSLGKERAIREMTVELAQVQPGDKVLEVGCGTGSLAIVAKSRAGLAGEVHGIDPAPEMIDVARRKAARMGMEVDFQIGLIEDIPFPDAQFDVVLSSLMLHHLPDEVKRKGFVEIRRVLKPGGRFLGIDFEPPTNPMIRSLATLLFGHHMLQIDNRKLPPMMEEAGFTAIAVGQTRFKVLSFVRGNAGKA